MTTRFFAFVAKKNYATPIYGQSSAFVATLVLKKTFFEKAGSFSNPYVY
jgi:hypothetical protein